VIHTAQGPESDYMPDSGPKLSIPEPMHAHANGNQFPIIFPHQLGTILQYSAGSDAENAWYLPARAEE